MSGHSKWSQIKRQKGTADAKRGQAFTKFANAITLSVKQGGGIGDPSQNFKLRLMIEKARSINMPKENIERAIKRAEGKQAETFESVVCEGFAPGRVGIIVEAATDNKMRTVPEIKNIFDKNGGTMTNSGSVSYLFTQKGLITAKKTQSLDDIFLLAADSGAEDVEDADEEVLIYTKPEELAKVKDKLSETLTITDAELVRKPAITVRVEDKKTADKILALVDKLESLDEVQNVFSNFDIPDTLLE